MTGLVLEISPDGNFRLCVTCRGNTILHDGGMDVAVDDGAGSPMLSRPKNIRHDRPPVDEWGIYDPEQAGLAAVAARLESRRRAAAIQPSDAESLAASMREANNLVDNKEK